jgi:hypothetical protein
MLMLYFSGTGNSKYIADTFSRHMDAKCHSIEEQLDYGQLLVSEETIAFCYPIFGSRVPRIMREFVAQHIEYETFFSYSRIKHNGRSSQITMAADERLF